MNRFSSKLFLGFALGAAGYTAARALIPAYSFQNKVVVISGGSRGLGLALARKFAGEKARLAILARDEAELDRAAADLRARGAEVFTRRCDVCEESEIQSAISEIASHFGALDVLINNAGEIVVGPLQTMTRADFEQAMAIHFWAPFHFILAALPHLRRQPGGGRIVNISSFGGKLAVPHLAAYCASKFALVGLSDALRAELAKDNVCVTTVCPGLMRTGSHLNAFFKGEHRREFALFSLGDALPLFSMNAERAARQIVEACRRAQPQLIITMQAWLAVLAQTLFPNLTARVVALTDRFLPTAANSASAKEKRTGWESRSELAPSLFTRLADRATERLNGLRGHAPITL